MSNKAKRKIAIFLPNLSGGGAEKVFVSLSSAFMLNKSKYLDVMFVEGDKELCLK